tara:strand:- start:15618 stop:16550 length:933 start_codon:yes stop_codon:yes gene_type:complete
LEAEKLSILTSFLGRPFNNGTENLFTCPYCRHHKKKLSINVEKNVWKCWICNKSGRNVFSLVKKFGTRDNINTWQKFTNFVEINRFEDIFFAKQEEEVKQIIALPEEFRSLTSNKLPLTAKQPLNYLRKRGITRDVILKWKLGYCLEGEYKNRIIVPSFDEEGELNYFIARTFADDYIKYKNPPVSKDIIFNELAIDWDEDITLVEGVFDCFKSQNSIPLLGSSLNENSCIFQKIMLKSKKVYFALDKDAKRKENKLIRLFQSYGIEVFKINLGEKEDMGEVELGEFKKLKQSANFTHNDNYLIGKIEEI